VTQCRKEKENMFYKINGRAGHGKTTELVNDVQDMYDEDLEIWQQSFVLITPTNKAAMVLNSRLEAVGLPHLARTLHSTLYMWTPTNKIKTTRRVRFIDPDTGKFGIDDNGDPVYHTETEYYMQKRIKNSIKNKIVFVDESSMVGSEVWHDLITCGLVHEIHAYGDERQLPPIERLEDLEPQYQPYYRFWHSYAGQVKTLTKSYRHVGTLKDIVDTIENSLFNGKYGSDIPSNLMYGDNFTVHCNDLTEADLLREMTLADIIITPYNKVRILSNIICRRAIAQATGSTFNPLPIVNDKIIFVDAIKTVIEVNGHGQNVKQIYLPKNVNAVIKTIRDISINDNLMIIDFIDEMGTLHENITVSLNTIMGATTNTGAPRIDYAYAVTVHSSQGAGWNNVLFLNGHWPGEDSVSLRYVGITRAQKRLAVVNGITNSTESKDADRSIVIRLGKMLGWK
jgi:hypothetical protein